MSDQSKKPTSGADSATETCQANSVNLDQLNAYREAFGGNAAPSQAGYQENIYDTGNGYTVPWNPPAPLPNTSPAPCPSCGRCPTCGRGGWNTYPWPYFAPYIYCNA